MTTKNSKKIENYTLFEVRTSENQVIQIERTSNWEINITQTAKIFGCSPRTLMR